MWGESMCGGDDCLSTKPYVCSAESRTYAREMEYDDD